MTIQEEILRKYHVCQSIKETAATLQVSESVVRKTLVTEGIYLSHTAERIQALAATGMSPHEIALTLKLSKSAVCSNMPYIKCSYLSDEKTINARRIQKSRAKKKAESQK